jgi:GH18 family chitinase
MAEFSYISRDPDLMKITNNAALRTKFVQSVLSIVDSLEMDGLLFSWKWPQCVEASVSIHLWYTMHNIQLVICDD